MSNIIIKLIRTITSRCPKCGQKLSCIDYEGYGYALWYCPKCNGKVENDCVKSNELVNSNNINEEEIKNGNK